MLAIPALPVDAFVGTPAGRCVAAAAAAPGGLHLPPGASLGGTPGGPLVGAAHNGSYTDAYGKSVTVGPPVGGYGGAPWVPRSHAAGLGWLRPASAVVVRAVMASAPGGRVPADVLLLASPYETAVWQAPAGGRRRPLHADLAPRAELVATAGALLRAVQAVVAARGGVDRAPPAAPSSCTSASCCGRSAARRHPAARRLLRRGWR